MLERFSYDIRTWLTIVARWTDRRCCDLHESRQLHLDFGILRQRRICPSNSVLEDHCERAVCFWRKMPGPDVLNCGFREEWMAGSRFCPDLASALITFPAFTSNSASTLPLTLAASAIAGYRGTSA